MNHLMQDCSCPGMQLLRWRPVRDMVNLNRHRVLECGVADDESSKRRHRGTEAGLADEHLGGGIEVVV